MPSYKPNALRRQPEHRAWLNMVQRCHNPKHRAYPRYGGRGIIVCERWRESYDAFAEDMGRRPSPAHSLDRIDNDRGYEPGNCQWRTRIEQNRNRRDNRMLTYNGETRCITEWGLMFGVRPETIADRIGRGGWPIERALKTPGSKPYVTPRPRTNGLCNKHYPMGEE